MNWGGVATNRGDPHHMKNSPVDEVNITVDYVSDVVYPHDRR